MTAHLQPPGAARLVVRDVSVRFGGLAALTAVSLEVEPGSTMGLIGPNGAGKTTLFNCISGFVPVARGGIVAIDDADVTGRPIHRVAAAGVARTFQNIALVPEQTVRENLMAGCHLVLRYGPLHALVPGRAVREQEAEAMARVVDVARLLDISSQLLDRRVSTLSLGLQKKIEVGRAIVRRPKLLLLDEPGGGLNDHERASLEESLRTLRRSVPITTVLVDHGMDLVMNLCDRICVLESGRVLAVGTPAEVSARRDVIDSYLGDGLAA